VIGCRTSWASSSKAIAIALAAAGCAASPYKVILPPPGASVPLSIDGTLRMRDLDELSPKCVDFVRDVGHVDSSQHLALLVPGGDADVAAESLTFAQGLREAGYVVRRTHRRKLEKGETLVEVFPIADGALQLEGGKVRAWRVDVEVRLFSRSDEPPYASRQLDAESRADLPRP
jgi:hypothetical protein